ncbi:MAG: aldehyde oxidase, partial [Candidatus Marinimicrobia bacterium]|nr:aldehyde oxidase [Candidatus Neomarinimicrobiota bacterium]
MKVIGKITARVDGRALATGQPVFADDIQPANLLYCKILHSPVAHARIKNIDTTRAVNREGVRLVLTHRDFPLHYYTTAG